jgi:hypothetical protein
MLLTDEIYSRLIFKGEYRSTMSLDGMKERCDRWLPQRAHTSILPE